MIVHSVSALQEFISQDLIVAKCRWVDVEGGGGHSLGYSNAKLIVAVRPLPTLSIILQSSGACIVNRIVKIPNLIPRIPRHNFTSTYISVSVLGPGLLAPSFFLLPTPPQTCPSRPVSC